MCANVDQRAYMRTYQKRTNFSFLHGNVPINGSTYQRARCVSVIQFGMLACQETCQIFKFACQKPEKFFNYFSNEFFNFRTSQVCLTFSNFRNVWTILENFSRETKNLIFDICKISLRKNFIGFQWSI